LRTGIPIGADACVPRITGIAVREPVRDVRPAPVGVEHDRGGLGGARSTGGTRREGERWVGLGCVGTDLLTEREVHEGEQGGEGGGEEHRY
jgi:hypothetical protein